MQRSEMTKQSYPQLPMHHQPITINRQPSPNTRKFPPFRVGGRNFPNANSKQFLSRFLPAAPQKYAPKFLRVPYFITGFTRDYKNHAPSEHSRAMTAIQLSTLNQPLSLRGA